MIRLLALLTVWSFLSSLGIAAPTAPTPVIDLGYAKIQGTFNASDNVSAFLGIRFAAPPVGTESFQYTNFLAFC